MAALHKTGKPAARGSINFVVSFVNPVYPQHSSLKLQAGNSLLDISPPPGVR